MLIALTLFLVLYFALTRHRWGWTVLLGLLFLVFPPLALMLALALVLFTRRGGPSQNTGRQYA